MVGDTKLFVERQNQSAKPFRPWSETIVIVLNNNEIRRQAILPMVGSVSTLVKIVLPMVGDAQPMVEEMKLLAKRQRQ
jgi:hypothetical protein